MANIKKFLGIMGIGGRIGSVHLEAFLKLVQPRRTHWGLAFCTTNDAVARGDLSGITQNNLGIAVRPQFDVSGMHVHRTPDSLSADPDVVAVIVATPTGLRRLHVTTALQNENHVLAEKPIDFTAAGATDLLALAGRQGRLLCCGQILGRFVEFNRALTFIREWRTAPGLYPYGPLRHVNLHRYVAVDNETADPANLKTTGGTALDLPIHDLHFVLVSLGRPQALQASGTVRDGVVTHIRASLLYAGQDGNSVQVQIDSGATLTHGRQFDHGFTLDFDHASVRYGLSGPAMTVFDRKKRTFNYPDLPPVGGLEAFGLQMLDFLHLVENPGNPQGILSGDAARDAVELCELVQQSVHSGGKGIVLS